MSAFGRKLTPQTLERHLRHAGLTGLEPWRAGVWEGWSAPLEVPDQRYTLTAGLDPDSRWLALEVAGLPQALLDDTPADRVHGMLLALTVLNRRIPAGAFCYDPGSGAVLLRHTVALSRGSLSDEDLGQLVGAVRGVLAERGPDLRAVIAGERTAREILG